MTTTSSHRGWHLANCQAKTKGTKNGGFFRANFIGVFFLTASSADLGKEICVCTTLHHFLATSQYLSIAYYYCNYCDHILGIFRLYRGTRCDQL